MNIAIVTYVINTHSGARSPIDLAGELAPKHEVTMYATEKLIDKKLYKELTRKGVRIVCITDALKLLKWIRFFKNTEHDIFSLHSSFPINLAVVLSGKPHILTYYGSQWNALSEHFFPPPLKIKILDIFLNFYTWARTFLLVSLAQEVTAISKTTQKELTKIYFKKSTHIYLGATKWNRSKKNGRTKNDKMFRLLSVSRLTPYKQFEKIVYTVGLLRNQGLSISLTVAGPNSQSRYTKFLRKIIKTPDTLLIDPSDSDLDRAYEQTDLYVTADRFLFFGLPIVEAGSHKKPTVAYNNQAAKEMIIHGKTGFVAETDTEFRDLITNLYSNRKLLKKMGEQAQERIKKYFLWETTLSQYIKLFTQHAKK